MNNLDFAAEKLNGKVWVKNGKYRVYLQPSFKNGTQSIYLDFDEIIEDVDGQNFMNGGVLKVFTNCKNQPVKWNIDQSKRLKHAFMLKIAKITGEQVCESHEDVIL